MLIHGCPAIIYVNADDRQIVDVLLQRRFLFHLELTNQPKDTWRAWTERLPYNAFVSVPHTGDHALPKSIHIITVDELNPQNNRESIQFVQADSLEANQ